jgi:uncharacterized protein YgbK (DUF1537 family)
MITEIKRKRIEEALGKRCGRFIVKNANTLGILNLKGGSISGQVVYRLLCGKVEHLELEDMIMLMVVDREKQ